MKHRSFFVAFIFTPLFFLPLPVSANPSNGTVEVGPNPRSHDSYITGASKKVPSKPQNRPRPGRIKPPPTLVRDRPSCEIALAKPGDTAPVKDCGSTPCGDGGTEYIRTIEDTATGKISAAQIVCKPPGGDVAALAINEFHKNTAKVSRPTISPLTTTLANFPNIFSSDVRAYTETTGITVAAVRIQFIPTAYRWDFGDGTVLDTTDPGKPFDPDHPETVATTREIEKNFPITHRYRYVGKVSVTLTVTFRGQYSVNGGEWTDIAGRVQASSPPHELTVKQARGRFVSGDGS